MLTYKALIAKKVRKNNKQVQSKMKEDGKDRKTLMTADYEANPAILQVYPTLLTSGSKKHPSQGQEAIKIPRKR